MDNLTPSENTFISVILLVLSMIFDSLKEHLPSFLTFLIFVFINFPKIVRRVKDIRKKYFK